MGNPIVGNVVGIPNPQPDWLQEDGTKADYIRNKPTYVSDVKKYTAQINDTYGVSINVTYSNGENKQHITHGIYTSDSKPKPEDNNNLITSKAVYDALKGKVDKEDGKGLSVVDAYPLYRMIDGEEHMNGINFVYQEGFSSAEYFYTVPEIDAKLSERATVTYVEEVEAVAKGRATGYVFDTYDSMVAWLDNEEYRATLKLGDNLYIRALDVPDYWWDGSTPQPLETQKVDLSEYVKKQEGLGLSESRYVGLSFNDNDTLLTINHQGGSSQSINLYSASEIDEKFDALPKAEDIDLSGYYTAEEVDNKLNAKQNKVNMDVDVLEDEEGNLVLTLIDNSEVYVGVVMQPLVLYFPEDGGAGYQSFFIFNVGNSLVPITVTAKCDNTKEFVKFIGDDCSKDGKFTPMANTTYEVSVKYIGTYEEPITTESGDIITVIRKHYVARVGAC